jgi:hypothetical protein
MSREHDNFESNNDQANTGPLRDGNEQRLPLGSARRRVPSRTRSPASLPASDGAISQADGFALPAEDG